eukprot:6211963-Pleurochrysis_carterae.AAC.3
MNRSAKRQLSSKRRGKALKIHPCAYGALVSVSDSDLVPIELSGELSEQEPDRGLSCGIAQACMHAIRYEQIACQTTECRRNAAG